MERGNRVRYDSHHWLWLDDAGRVPQLARRIDFCGTVLHCDNGTALVEWDAGRPIPKEVRTQHYPHPSVHLVENLEAL